MIFYPFRIFTYFIIFKNAVKCEMEHACRAVRPTIEEADVSADISVVNHNADFLNFCKRPINGLEQPHLREQPFKQPFCI